MPKGIGLQKLPVALPWTGPHSVACGQWHRKYIMHLVNLVYQLVIAEKEIIPQLSDLEQQSFIIFYVC